MIPSDEMTKRGLLPQEEAGSTGLAQAPYEASEEGIGSLWVAIACFALAAICGVALLLLR